MREIIEKQKSGLKVNEQNLIWKEGITKQGKINKRMQKKNGKTLLKCYFNETVGRWLKRKNRKGTKKKEKKTGKCLSRETLC